MPRFHEKPEAIIFNIKGLLDIDESKRPEARMIDGRAAAQKFVDDSIAEMIRSPFNTTRSVFGLVWACIAWLFMRLIGIYFFRLVIYEFREAFGIREKHKFLLVQMFGYIRLLALSLGKKCVSEGLLLQQDDLFYCSFPDLRFFFHIFWRKIFFLKKNDFFRKSDKLQRRVIA